MKLQSFESIGACGLTRQATGISKKSSVAVKDWQFKADHMRGRIAAIVLICAAAVSPANGRAVSAATRNAHGPCRVVAGEKLLVKAGGPDGLCNAVERAVLKSAPKARY